MVHDPQATTCELLGTWTCPPDERLRDVATIVDLDQQCALLAPHPQRAGAAAVVHAVGRKLGHRQNQLFGTFVTEPQPQCPLTYKLAQPPHRSAGERQLLCAGGGPGES